MEVSKLESFTKYTNHKEFNWFEALSIIIDENTYTAHLRDMFNLSGNWVSCACGNQCAIIPRDGDGEPLDGKLSNLGIRFHDTIKLMFVDFNRSNYDSVNEMRYQALDILNQIEKRSTILIKEINLNGN